jgi:ribosomal protein S18 acetylase RimI-like enzyme
VPKSLGNDGPLEFLKINDCTLREEPLSELHRYVSVRSCFETHALLDVYERGGGVELCERSLDRPYRKDYDALENSMDWPRLFDVANWIAISAFCGDSRMGGIIGALDTGGVDLLEGRRDLVVVWDVRVSQDAQRQGVGSALLAALESRARTRYCRELEVETQNSNVAACRFYARRGFRLTQVTRNAYPTLPSDIQMIWRKEIVQD